MSNKYSQSATYWAPSSLNEYAEFDFSSPTVINVRWEEKKELFIDKETGNQILSNSIVYSEIDLEQEGWLYLGESSATNPKSVSSAFEIKSFSKIPSVSANKYIRKSWL